MISTLELRPFTRWLLICLALCAQGLWPREAAAQFGGGGLGLRAVGGISIDADGIVRNLDRGALESLADDRREALAGSEQFGNRTNDGLPAEPARLRKVSLARIMAAALDPKAAAAPPSSDIVFLGGLERITHVFVDPDGHDIILAGPADRPVVDASGTVVGGVNGRPLLQFEDLVVALRAIDQARAGGMRCSIDPTPEGIAALQTFLSAQRTIGPDPAVVFRGMEEALGPQTVSVGGVPADSRFARVLVAADYRMKRIGMGLEPSGIKELPSYLALMPAGAKTAALPRFWLEAEYEPIARDADELAWKLSGRRMKCLTESDAFGKGGVQRGQGRGDAATEKWCPAMTPHYAQLAATQPVFAELENCVDLAVVAALIHGRQLAARAGLDLGPLLDATALPLPRYEVPTQVPTVATGVRKGSNWVLSASGGIQFQPWHFAAETVTVAAVADSRAAALAAKPASRSWWD